MASSFLAWYRRCYLLINVPLLFLIANFVVARLDLARFKVNDLEIADARLRAYPPEGKPVLLLVGNSGMREAVDEAQLETALGAPDHPIRVYNYGLSSARISDVFELTRRLLGSGLKPTAVVLGLNPFLIDDHVNPDSRFPWNHSPMPYLYAHRSILRELAKKGSRRMSDPHRYADAPPTPAQRAFAVDGFLHEFDHRPIDYPLLDQVPEFLAWLRDQGIAVHVIVLPLSPDGAKLSNFHELVAAVRSKAPPGSLDLAERYPYTMFADIGHVTATARKQITVEVAGWLAGKGAFAR
ncbi:MAG TPA: hypothetical protein VFT22_27855 [Kofleriaceae bacterium]|nr:hypothetical protein [Kofleriaceae bacterium]